MNRTKPEEAYRMLVVPRRDAHVDAHGAKRPCERLARPTSDNSTETYQAQAKLEAGGVAYDTIKAIPRPDCKQ